MEKFSKILGKLKFQIIQFYLLLCIGNSLLAQIDPKIKNHTLPSVKLIGKSFGDSIVLRWAPNSPELWHAGNNFGYVVEKRTIIVDDSVFVENPETRILSLKPV